MQQRMISSKQTAGCHPSDCWEQLKEEVVLDERGSAGALSKSPKAHEEANGVEVVEAGMWLYRAVCVSRILAVTRAARLYIAPLSSVVCFISVCCGTQV